MSADGAVQNVILGRVPRIITLWPRPATHGQVPVWRCKSPAFERHATRDWLAASGTRASAGSLRNQDEWVDRIQAVALAASAIGLP